MKRRFKIEVMLLLFLSGALLGSKVTSVEYFNPLVDVHYEISRYYVEQPDEQKLLEGAIQGMIGELNDPYTDYLSPDVLNDFDKQTRATFIGIGAEIDEQNESIVIVTPLEDSPALKAGILAGDVILEIDGKTTEKLTSAEAVKRITGPEGTQVKLKVRHPTGEEAELTITRRRIVIQTVKGFRRDKSHHWDYMLDAPNGVAYIRVTQFSEPTTKALIAAVASAKAAGMKGLVLDLRFNPGGLLEQAVEVSDLFLTSGTIVSSSGRNRPEVKLTAKPEDDLGEFPMVVLVNESSASASEIVAGALKDNNDRAVIVGARTFGKGSVQEIHALSGGAGAMKVTTALYYLPSGRNLHRKEGSDTWGVDPNDGFYIPMTGEQIEAMIKARLSSDIVHNGDQSPGAAEPITAEYLETELADPQLAGAYRAILGKLQNGEYAAVGESNATLMAHMTEKAALERARDTLQERLDSVNKRLKEIDAKVAATDTTSSEKAKAEEKTEEAEPAGAPPKPE